MLLSDLSVKRPVFASVVSLILVVFGLVAFDRLPLREYPDIDPPIVTVSVTYPGAPANVVETRVTRLLEERVAGIEGIEYISSSSGDGQAQVSIEFSINRDIDGAANDVRDRIAGIQDNLPVEADPPEIQKVDSNDDVIIWQNLASTTMSVPELTDYAQRYLVDQYATLDGVARVRVGGGLSYAMRVWLDRQELAARKISVVDVESALRAANVELPAGSLESDQQLFKARVNRVFLEPQDFAKLVVAEGDGGYLVRLGDVARVELGLIENRTFFRGNGVPMVGIGTVKQSTANTIDVARNVKRLTKELNATLPEGMSIEPSYDASIFIEAAIAEVYSTLLIAIICVVLVIYGFLGSWRATLIPAITVPVSVIATFIVIDAFGFTVNLLTLLALVLAIGMVVDDAIVVLENIVRHMHEFRSKPLVAAYRGSRQVGFAVVATTLVLVAVFVPITFLEGDIGKLFTEFAVTISAAVAFSSLIALTMSPMLASKILRADEQNGKLAKWVDKSFAKLKVVYQRWLLIVIAKPWHMLGVFVALLGGALLLNEMVEREFVPREDRGAFFVLVNGPEGASYKYMEEYMNEIEARLMSYVSAGEVSRLLVRAPRAFGRIESFNSGFVIVLLERWEKRRPAEQIIGEVRQKLADLPGVRAFPIMRSGLGGGAGKPVQFVIGGATYEELVEWRDIMLAKAREAGLGLTGLDSDFQETRPQLDFKIDYDRAASLGVTVEDVGRTLQTMLGGRRVTTYLDRGEEYDVIVEGDRQDQKSFDDINNIYVRSRVSGALIPMANLVTIQEYGAAKNLSRYNRIRAITLEANLAEGATLGRALAGLKELAEQNLPERAIIDYKGQSRDFMKSASSAMFVFLMGLLIVFLVLAAQFESYLHPFIIMLTVPLATGGGLLGLWLTGNSLNIYSQIGLIMLIGLAAKNGILIVEFANQLRDEGVAFREALLAASVARLRPIVMTGLTTVAGALPLIFTSGAGAETRQVIGIVILAGVSTATVFTLFFIPAAYFWLGKKSGSPGQVSRELQQQLAANPTSS